MQFGIGKVFLKNILTTAVFCAILYIINRELFLEKKDYEYNPI
jgi:hypothetical protein